MIWKSDGTDPPPHNTSFQLAGLIYCEIWMLRSLLRCLGWRMRKNNPLIGLVGACRAAVTTPHAGGDILACKPMSEDPNCAYSPVLPQMTRVVWVSVVWNMASKQGEEGRRILRSLQLDAEFNQLMGRPGAFPICRYSNDIYAVINLVLFTDRINTINKYTQEWSSFFSK